MKNLKYLQKIFFLLVMTASCAGFMACGSDDPDPIEEPEPETNYLVGVWECKHMYTQGVELSYYCFYENLTGYKVLCEYGHWHDKHYFQYVYNKETGNLQLTYTEDGKVKTRRVITCNATTLEIIGSNERLSTYTRIDKEPVMPEAEHEWVDLGLSVKWATCNVGASSPEEYGDYFAWGETTTKSDYDRNNSTTGALSTSTLKSRGIIDSDGNLTDSYDAATANWGSAWRMPTFDEIKELLNNCTWEWTTYEGVNGRLVIGPNGNSIFLPAAGYRYGTDLDNAGSYGYYWSATLGNYSSDAHDLIVGSDYYGWGEYGFRYNGHTVRPVSDGLLSDSEK